MDLADYTFCEAISRGWGIAGNCRPCGEVHKLSDKALAERFIKHLDKPLSILKGRLFCPDCGNKALILFPYQAGAMDWPGLSVATSDMPSVSTAREERLREMAANA